MHWQDLALSSCQEIKINGEKYLELYIFFFFLISGIVHFFYMLTDDRVSKISFDSIFFPSLFLYSNQTDHDWILLQQLK